MDMMDIDLIDILSASDPHFADPLFADFFGVQNDLDYAAELGAQTVVMEREVPPAETGADSVPADVIPLLGDIAGQAEVIDLVTSSDEDSSDVGSPSGSSTSESEDSDDEEDDEDEGGSDEVEGEVDPDAVEDEINELASLMHTAAAHSARQYDQTVREVKMALKKALDRMLVQPQEQQQQQQQATLVVREPRNVAEECPVCMYTAINTMLAPCGHCICHTCLGALRKHEVRIMIG